MIGSESEIYLVVGLGNPGKAYEWTRHNVGFHVVELFAQKKGFSNFRRSSQLEGEIAEGNLYEKKTLVLKPMAYMNLSGHSVRRCCDYYKIAPSHLLVISDEADLPLGSMRLREKGSAGGHKGLQSIEEELHEHYPRLRVGVDRPAGGEELADYVLGRFTEEERPKIAETIERATQVIDLWLSEGIEAAQRFANRRMEIGEDNGKS